MTDPVGNTTYRHLNVEMLKGDMEVGSTADRVESAYRKNTASLGKRIALGILTVGIYAMVQTYRDYKYSKTMHQLSLGTENFYKNLSDLSSARLKGEQHERRFDMCGEQVTLKKTAEERWFVTFQDRSEHEIKYPKDILHRLEKDVMEHSELFERSLVVDTILSRYEHRIDEGLKDDNAEFFTQFNDLDKKKESIEQKFFSDNDDDDLNEIFDAVKMHHDLMPKLVEAKTRYDELISVLFESRLGLDKTETAYIDRSLGKQLAAAVMDGNLTTADDARAFINRNASKTHFTTLDAARVHGQFVKAQKAELEREQREKYALNEPEPIGPETSSIQFKDGYYQPLDNPVLPVGELKEIHDFVADLISNSNVIEMELDLNKDSRVEGQRLRELFKTHMELIGKLMQNRVEYLSDPQKPYLLSTIDPKLREVIEQHLDELNADYDKKFAQRKTHYEQRAEWYQKSKADPKSSKDLLADLNKERFNALQAMEYYEDRKNYLHDLIRFHERQENALRTEAGTSNVEDISNPELDIIGAQKNFKETFDKKMGDIDFLSEKRDEIGIALNFFGNAEKRINEQISTSCRELQQEVSRLIENVFPKAPAKPVSSVAEVRQATLAQIIGSPIEDNQLQLLKTALELYFKNMPLMDQRAMLAAGTRYCIHSAPLSASQRLGAILKGAGPVMQKMLQGLDPSLFKDAPDFQLAIADMKDKLAPLEKSFIQEQLFDLVKNSNGRISGITVDKALGAASVAQTFKCTITFSDRSRKQCVIKLLRPDAPLRAQREQAVFEEAAKMVGNGVLNTFKGRFQQIMQEMDLRHEAENLKQGEQIYDFHRQDYQKQQVTQSYGSFSNVHSVKSVDGVVPRIGAVVMELVEGDTLENYLSEIGTESRKISSQTQKQIDEHGPDNAPHHALQGAKALTRLYTDIKNKYESLVNLSYMWGNEGLFATGFYHGDIHKGNLMTKADWKQPDGQLHNSGITLIDFGNASQLTNEQSKSIVKIVAGAATGDASLFEQGFKNMLSEESLAKFTAQGAVLTDKLAAIFEKGTIRDTTARLNAALALLQREYKIEIPAHVHNFIESQKRLQIAMNETLSTLRALERQRAELIEPYLDRLPDGEEKQELTEALEKAKHYRPASMVKSLTDVVSQNLYATMKAIGGIRKANQCYEKIKSELEAQEQGNLIEA